MRNRRSRCSAALAVALFPVAAHCQTTGPATLSVSHFDVVFNVTSRANDPIETEAIHLAGKPPIGLHRDARGNAILSSADLESHPLQLGLENGVYTAPDPANPAQHKVVVRLKDLDSPEPKSFTPSAITHIRGTMVRALHGYDIYSARTWVDDKQLEASGDPNDPAYKDLRAASDRSLKIVVQLGVVTAVRTVASGDRIAGTDATDAPQHESIRYRSPVRPADSSNPPARSDLLRKDELDDYFFALNRHPGRRVDVALSPADVPGGMTLDYLVAESKPWTLFAQVSNTGTRETNDWRERFGFIHNQLSGRDDTLVVDYITAGFDDASQAVLASYEFPLPTLQNLRARVYGSYTAFTASDVGQTGSDNDFSGETVQGGAELIANVFQHRDWFGDLFAGARVEHIHTNNILLSSAGAGGEGSSDFIAPYVGARLEHTEDTSTLGASATLTYYHTDDDALALLGRTDPDEDAVTLEVGGTFSFYVEPLIFPDLFATAPGQRARQLKLANEVALSARASTAFGSRLVPQHEEVLGGLFSIRGYPESITAGDDVVLASAEYRFHLPRALDLQPTPARVFGRPFRVAPDRELGRPDWDLILKAFLDAGHSRNSDKQSFEDDQTLVGTGLGVELQLKQNFNFQVFWGVALTDADNLDWEAGDNRFHFLFTALY